MDEATFDRLVRIFNASEIVWARMQATPVGTPEWVRLRKKHALIAQRYRLAREMSEPRTIN